MLDFLKRIFADSSSRKQANDRLRVVLTHDRAGTSSRLMETLKEEILEVISRHVEIEGRPEVKIIRDGRHSALDINIPLKGR
ncbi:MAG: cell division topological specificity factor MinE [Syntrophomonas sp.]|uniref:cell division topological specificity factor MinE n=1 Tax=Syntrophomonas sp. TaxID=2053627 RepID=UPI002632E770|nr:cell division topological specificity factor MinE [Syntrophomonas sp.]MDD2511543.1 cell division topological specificity factor MinE [Syntrophomonas sp.]MDD4627658.1 cell division topological specificity factor MinE [Syntrophomonas sp.]